ncbi:hypothetical protein KY289_036854 [Solanum tuberosum]|nr:hypothetical protein KY289_036854 [Solanum tuberosum]
MSFRLSHPVPFRFVPVRSGSIPVYSGTGRNRVSVPVIPVRFIPVPVNKPVNPSRSGPVPVHSGPMQEVAGKRGGYLHGRGTLDSDDLLYQKEQMEAEEDAERLLRRTEKRAFQAF